MRIILGTVSIFFSFFVNQMPDRWDDVRVKVIRPGPVDQRGVCANSIPQEDLKATSLPQGKFISMAGPFYCLHLPLYKIPPLENRLRG